MLYLNNIKIKSNKYFLLYSYFRTYLFIIVFLSGYTNYDNSTVADLKLIKGGEVR